MGMDLWTRAKLRTNLLASQSFQPSSVTKVTAHCRTRHSRRVTAGTRACASSALAQSCRMVSVSGISSRCVLQFGRIRSCSPSDLCIAAQDDAISICASSKHLQTRRFLDTLKAYLLETQRLLVQLHREANAKPSTGSVSPPFAPLPLIAGPALTGTLSYSTSLLRARRKMTMTMVWEGTASTWSLTVSWTSL